MKYFDAKTRELNNGQSVIVTSAGDFLLAEQNPDNIKNLLKTSHKQGALKERGFIFNDEDDLYFQSAKFREFKRRNSPRNLNYIIAVPTLRCDLACSYCQVSRANENATGYDWDDTVLTQFLSFVEISATNNVKIEFQGGEPTLRIDLVEKVINAVNSMKTNPTFVICTNLSNVSNELEYLLKKNNVSISSSLDGPPYLHKKNRTNSEKSNDAFFSNLEFVLKNYGNDKISLLPTIADYTQTSALIDYYRQLGLNEIFLRPVNFQGFARKAHAKEAQDTENWINAYISALEYIEQQNSISDNKIIETGLAIHLKRIFSDNAFDYVDFRNPNNMGVDYLVVNYDGTIFPTDEARMLFRTGIVDLSIGSLIDGLDKGKISKLNSRASNFGDKDCDQCAYQIFCGVDNVDKLSRHGTLDVNTVDTFFCKTHMATFDFVFQKIASKSPSALKNLSLHLIGEYTETSLFSDSYYD